MLMESQAVFGSEAHLHSENISVLDGAICVTSSTPSNFVELQPEPAKKPTRQWAAWTRQEEESFFSALRQVGKNFEKITCRVQSKNKDQVRHYYYRLVRRMNKLLGPGLCLDAKNSKDTNAAMLRWWSLLEKYSCKASKLHLKPRRFKIFIEALENQLLKDRKKNVRKRSSPGENCSPTTAFSISNQNKALGQDTRAVKLVLIDSQNIPKLGPMKGPMKRNVNAGISRCNSKGDAVAMKSVRQRRKPGLVSPSAYKKWEKAAIAGVSLVADAAEHLERTTTDKEVEQDQVRRDQDPVGKYLTPLPKFSQNLYVESTAQASLKLKLQLFPIDDGTRRALEMDKHNPHLELTLSTRKKISSVLEHLNRKWGSSSVASGELLLFPYNVQKDNLPAYQRWTEESVVSAADVYAMVGSPSVFRLRYGWFSNKEFGSVMPQAPVSSCYVPGVHNMIVENGKGEIIDTILPSSDQSQKLAHCSEDELLLNEKHTVGSHSTDMPSDIRRKICVDFRSNLAEPSDPAETVCCHVKESGNGSTLKQLEDGDDLRLSNGIALSAGEWADSLTNITIGDLLSEQPRGTDANLVDPAIAQSSQCVEQIPLSWDSFDAAIAAHIQRHQNKIVCPPISTSHASSILDAEDTCDAFLFRKNFILREEVPSLSCAPPPSACEQIARTSSVGSGVFLEKLPEEKPTDYADQGDPMSDCEPERHTLGSPTEDFNGLTDIYWPDSLGPLDLDIPSCKYHNEDLILSESNSGLNRLIASSLDAFQNCSFFGLDKKESTTTIEIRGTASFSDFKVGGGV